jgi:hypothetical protein
MPTATGDRRSPTHGGRVIFAGGGEPARLFLHQVGCYFLSGDFLLHERRVN